MLKYRQGTYLACAVLVALLAIGFTLPALSQDDLFRVVGVRSGDTLKLRSAPKADAGVRGTIPAGSMGIVRVGECTEWCLVRFNDITGWVNKRFLAADQKETSTKTVTSSSNPFEDCNSDDSARKLTGCGGLISRSGLDAISAAVAHSRRSDVHIAAGKFDQAIADRVKASLLQPDDVVYKMRLSQAYQLRAASRELTNHADGALADQAEAIRVDPSNHQARFDRSNTYLTKNDIDKAIDETKAAIRVDPDNPLYRLWLAKLHDKRATDWLLKKDFPKAVADYTNALTLDSANASLFSSRAMAYAASSDLDKAVADYSEAIRLRPRSVIEYIRRGDIFYQRGELLRSISDLNEALTLDSANIDALMTRGLAREANEQLEYAKADYAAILKIEPTHKLAKASMERVNRVDTKR